MANAPTSEKMGSLAKMLSMVGASVALFALIYSSLHLAKIEKETAIANKEFQTAHEQLDTEQRRLAAAHSELTQTQLELSFANETYRRLKADVAPTTIQKALQETAAADPQSSQLRPIVYLHIARPDQLPRAHDLLNTLRNSGIQTARGVNDVGTHAPVNTQLRYFAKSDEGPDLQRVLSAVQSTGLNVEPKFIRMESIAPEALRPKQYELWFGQTSTP